MPETTTPPSSPAAQAAAQISTSSAATLPERPVRPPRSPAPAAAAEPAVATAPPPVAQPRVVHSKPVRMPVFAATAFAWMAVLIAVWMFVKPWTSYPVSFMAATALELGAPVWVSKAQVIGHAQAEQGDGGAGHVLVETGIAVPVPESQGRHAQVLLEADPSRYAYGLAIFLALLLAARQPGLWRKALAGYCLLLPFQAFTVVFYILKEIIVAAQIDYALLRVSPWQVEAIVYGFQLGTLIVPTLVPILVWLWLDRRFFNEVIVQRFTARRS
ncbi:exosortase H-associated membrane protein [Vandammella animalimorsus]|uniref:exosortase H-associated membrane protein n=1 Tax=Vandammella animalimorsus TaxID=2029117 RepID=UPI001EEE705F|nr:exosortase H-associated membrane protein [Vandammella animalimorsus]